MSVSQAPRRGKELQIAPPLSQALAFEHTTAALRLSSASAIAPASIPAIRAIDETRTFIAAPPLRQSARAQAAAM
jgi:hypothetical protein